MALQRLKFSLFGKSNDDFCTFRLENSLLTWASVIGNWFIEHDVWTSLIIHNYWSGKFECERCSLAQNKRRKSRNQQSGVNRTHFPDLQKQQVKNRQSMTARGYCCYYLEHCSKTNHIAIKEVIKRAKWKRFCTRSLLKTYRLVSCTIVYRGEWLWRPDKLLCCRFLFAFIYGLDRAKNTIVVYSVLRN